MSPVTGHIRGLHGQVVNDLGMAIASGVLRAHEQIVPEQVGARLGISRPVVREALRVLESKGMVTARPKTGTRVLPVTSWDVLDKEIITWRVHGPQRDAQLAELLDLRTVIEPLAARRCCDQATTEIIDGLFDICAQMEQAVAAENHEAFTQADVLFHTTILMNSGSHTLARLTGAIEAVLRARESLHLMPDHVDSSAAEAHRRIVEAIRDADAEAAENASRELVQVAADEIGHRLRSAERKLALETHDAK